MTERLERDHSSPVVVVQDAEAVVPSQLVHYESLSMQYREFFS